MLHLAISMARHRFAALLAVACAVLGGAALVTASGVLAETGWRSHLPPGRLAGAGVVVSADQAFHPQEDPAIALPERAPVPASLVARLARVPGVTAAAGDLSFAAAVIGPGGPLALAADPVADPTADPATAGHGWSSTALLGRPRLDGRPPAGPGDVVLDGATATAAGVRVGQQVHLVVAGRSGSYRLSGVLTDAGPGIYVADRTAEQLAGRTAGPRAGTVDLVALSTAPGAEEAVATAVRRELAGTSFVVSTGAARGDAASPGAVAARGVLVLLTASLAGVVLLVIGFVTAGALAVSIGSQRRELALMRAVGATPRQVRRLLAAQTSVIGAAALVPGLALGYLLADRFRSLLVDGGLIPAALPLTAGPLPAVAAVLLMALVVQVSARGAAWRTSRMPAIEAVAESRSEPRTPSRVRALAGLLIIVVALVLSAAPLLLRTALGAAATQMAGILAAIGLALAGPALIRFCGDGLARRLPRRASAVTWLAVANTRAYTLRVAGVVSSLAMVVIFALTYTLAQTTLTAATGEESRDGTLADLSIGAPSLGGVPDGVLDQVRHVPGVLGAAPASSTTVLWRYRMLDADEVESEPATILTPAASTVLDLDVRDGTLADLTGPTVAVGSEVARLRGATLGSTVDLVLGDGAVTTARVVAVYARSLGFGPLVVSRDLAAGHVTTGLDRSILVRTDGTDAARRGLGALAATRPGLAVQVTAGDPGNSGGTPGEVWINLALIVVLLGYLLLSIANKLVAATVQRRTEIAVLRLNGTTPGQIRSMMRHEAALIGVVAAGSALLLSAVPLGLVGVAFLHRPWPAGPIWLAPVAVLAVVGLAVLTMELPTRRALRTAPTEALSHHG